MPQEGIEPSSHGLRGRSMSQPSGQGSRRPSHHIRRAGTSTIAYSFVKETL